MLSASFKLDWRLLIPVLILSLLSLTILGSISLKFFFTQLLFLLLGLISFYFFARFNFNLHYPLVNFYAVISLVLLLMPFLFGAVTRGSVRWISIGSLTLQPSEIIKPFLIIIFAQFLTKEKFSSSFKKLFSYCFLLLLPAFLIFKQPDLGSSLVVIAIWLGTLIASDIPLLHSLIFITIGIGTMPIAWHWLKPYQQQRILTFFNPFDDPKGSGYQVIQSVIAVGSGGLLGKGLGSGTQSQLKFLPERHTDFIFASMAEELGLIVSVFLILSYCFLLSRLLSIARNTSDRFGYLVIMGVFSMFFFQAFINIAMNLGLMPITGITLPFVSAGGSSLLASLISLGIVHNISQHTTSSRPLEIK